MLELEPLQGMGMEEGKNRVTAQGIVLISYASGLQIPIIKRRMIGSSLCSQEAMIFPESREI